LSQSKDDTVIIKKYANRRLYDTSASRYVTLDHLRELVRDNTDFKVVDAKSGEDLTRSVLAQIIFEEESKGANLLPVEFLRQLIGFYGDSMQAFVPGYLRLSMDNLAKQQDALRARMSEAMGSPPMSMGMLEEQTSAIWPCSNRRCACSLPSLRARPAMTPTRRARRAGRAPARLLMTTWRACAPSWKRCAPSWTSSPASKAFQNGTRDADRRPAMGRKRFIH